MNVLRVSIVFLIVSFFFTFDALSQNTSIGVKAGVNVAGVAGDNSDDTGSRTGLALGAYINYSVSGNFGLTGELNFAQKGSSFENGGFELTTKLDYLEIPVYGSYFFGEGDFRPELFLGGYYGILINAQTEDGEGNTQDVTEGFESGDFGLLFGAGFHYSLGNGKWLNADVRYGLGLADINPSDVFQNSNRALGINVGVTLPLGDY